MRNTLLFTFIATIPLAALSCEPSSSSAKRGRVWRPAEARVDMAADAIGGFGESGCDALLRYLASTERWELRQERGRVYAVRLERVDGIYETTLNGFYRHDDDDGDRTTRVLLALGEPYGLRVHYRITRAIPGDRPINLTIEGPHRGSPGYTSYLTVDGDEIFLEVYERAPELRRRFTQQALNDVSEELREVLRYIDVVAETGLLPAGSPHADPPPPAAQLEIRDGMQPGIYSVDAALNPRSRGYAFMKVFEAETNLLLSGEAVKERSLRFVGWSEDGEVYFPYDSELKVYEGDWDTQYLARFELWHHSETGEDVKHGEMTRMISGWQR
jgi:hypothetical protein